MILYNAIYFGLAYKNSFLKKVNLIFLKNKADNLGVGQGELL